MAFLGQYRLGFIIFGIITFIGTLIAAFIVREPSNLNEKVETPTPTSTKKKAFSLKELASVFPKWSVGRDFVFSIIGGISILSIKSVTR